MIKAKFGGALRSKTFIAQANEALCRFFAITFAFLSNQAAN
jgi:hypothetical protein